LSALRRSAASGRGEMVVALCCCAPVTAGAGSMAAVPAGRPAAAPVVQPAEAVRR